MEEQIGKIMLMEHERLLKELNYLEENVKLDLNNLPEEFKKIKQGIEKHFFLEEKAIFEICNSDCSGKVPETFQLMKEHGEILDLMKIIENTLETKPISEILKLKALLIFHSNFENEFFYPSLDKGLGDYTKKQILERIEKI